MMFNLLHRQPRRHRMPINIKNQDNLKNWSIVIKPNPGLLQRFNELEWVDISTLKGLDKHLRALREVTVVKLHSCRIFSSVEDMSPLTELGGTLRELEIVDAATSPAIMEHLLVGLPKLRRLIASNLRIESHANDDCARGSPVPQFFKDPNEMTLLLKDYSPENMGWIPQVARFSKLSIGIKCIVENQSLLNGWIECSHHSLKHFSLDLDDYEPRTFQQ